MLTIEQKQKLCQACPQRRNYFCTKHGNEWNTIIKRRDTCEGWGNEHKPETRDVETLGIVSCYFNPTGDSHRENAFRTFKHQLGKPAVIVELSFNNEFVFDDSIRLKGNSQNVLWQKERLLNLAIESLPDDVDAVAWIDADLIFENPNWYTETKQLLSQFQFVQMFERVNYLNVDGTLDRSFPSWASINDGGRVPGGAWAARCEAIPNGLPDKQIIGGGDWELIKTVVKDNPVGCTPGTVKHLYHGCYAQRQHRSRSQILSRHQFNPAVDLRRDEQGLWMWSSDKTGMHREVHEYFEGRNDISKSEPVRSLTAKPKLIPKMSSPVEPQKHRTKYACDVVIPYNGPNYRFLEDSIKSILNQNFVETTIHLINDGMHEDPIGEKYSELDNVRWYKNKISVGPYVTFNRLFDNLEHDYFANQDSDDISLPMRLYKSFEALSQGFDIVGGAMEQFVNYDDNSKRMKKALTNKPYHYSGITRFGSPSGNIVNSTILMSRSAYEDCNGYAGWKAGADSEFFERAIRSGFKAVALSDVVALRRLHNPSLSNDQVTSGHGSQLRDEIKRWTIESQHKRKPDHSIGGLAKHRHDKELERLNHGR